MRQQAAVEVAGVRVEHHPAGGHAGARWLVVQGMRRIWCRTRERAMRWLWHGVAGAGPLATPPRKVCRVDSAYASLWHNAHGSIIGWKVMRWEYGVDEWQPDSVDLAYWRCPEHDPDVYQGALQWADDFNAGGEPRRYALLHPAARLAAVGA